MRSNKRLTGRSNKRLTGRNRSKRVRFCSDDFYTSLAALVVHSGVTTADFEFLQGEWCSQLLDYLGISLSGMEIWAKYQERQERRCADNGKR